jgi:hypothetical protein
VATSLLPTGAKLTLPPNYLNFVGVKLTIRAHGRLSNLVTTPGTLTMDFRLGGTVVFNGAAMQLSTTAHTSVPWEMTVDLTVRAIGSSATLMGQGKFICQAVSISGADPTTGHSILMIPNSAPAVGTSFDSTAAQQADVFAKFSIGDPANSITLHQYELLSNVSY